MTFLPLKLVFKSAIFVTLNRDSRLGLVHTVMVTQVRWPLKSYHSWTMVIIYAQPRSNHVLTMLWCTHPWSDHVLIIYAHRWSDHVLIIYAHRWSDHVLIIYAHSWSDHVLIIYAHSWSDHVLIIYAHPWSDHVLIIYAHPWSDHVLIMFIMCSPMVWPCLNHGYHVLTHGLTMSYYLYSTMVWPCSNHGYLC